MIEAVKGSTPPRRVEVGQVWFEKETGRFVKILEQEVHGTGPAWTYCDEAGNDEPHGYEKANGFTYDDWYWHYCDIFDFVVWGRFQFVRSGK